MPTKLSKKQQALMNKVKKVLKDADATLEDAADAAETLEKANPGLRTSGTNLRARKMSPALDKALGKKARVTAFSRQTKAELLAAYNELAVNYEAVLRANTEFNQQVGSIPAAVASAENKMKESAHAANMWKSAYYVLLNQHEKMKHDADTIRELIHKELVPTTEGELDPELYAQQVHGQIDLACQRMVWLEKSLMDSLSTALETYMDSGKGKSFRGVLPWLRSKTATNTGN